MLSMEMTGRDDEMECDAVNELRQRDEDEVLEIQAWSIHCFQVQRSRV
jgi:hypothetical protein